MSSLRWSHKSLKSVCQCMVARMLLADQRISHSPSLSAQQLSACMARLAWCRRLLSHFLSFGLFVLSFRPEAFCLFWNNGILQSRSSPSVSSFVGMRPAKFYVLRLGGLSRSEPPSRLSSSCKQSTKRRSTRIGGVY